MSRRFEGWGRVAERLRAQAAQEAAVSQQRGDGAARLNAGQRASLIAVAAKIEHHGLVLADEVGMGKTRIAVEVARCVVACGGRVAIVLPPGLGYQWRAELKDGGLEVPDILRSLGAYFRPWEKEGQPPWFEHPVLLLSHVFANWHLGASSRARRWSLLPHFLAHWRKRTLRRWPDGYGDHAQLQHASLEARASRAAAESISHAVLEHRVPAIGETGALVSRIEWPQSLVGTNYGNNMPLRAALQMVVGLGLGCFDLVILDEAHKSRGGESGLSRLLDRILFCAPEVRRLALTATPVELDVKQWEGTLARIGVPAAGVGRAVQEAEAYAKALRALRSGWRVSADVREDFKAQAQCFHAALSPYVLRRDKREDPAVIAFGRRTGQPLHAYRDETREIVVDPADLSLGWRQAVCAAEALSAVGRRADGGQLKLLRLTMSHGHGVVGFVNSADIADGALALEDGAKVWSEPSQTPSPLASPSASASDDEVEARRQARIAWWRRVVSRVGEGKAHPLFEHPAIGAAVRAIEAAHAQGEKVLVFGRFTAPMQKLVELLNARDLLRRVDAEEFVPQSKVHADHGAAVDVAYAQWKSETGLAFRVERDLLDAELKRRYDREQHRLERSRASLTGVLREGIAQLGEDTRVPATARHRAALEIFCRMAEIEGGHDESGLVLLHRALIESIGGGETDRTPRALAAAFVELIDAAWDRDNPDDDPDGEVEENVDEDTWRVIVQCLREEYDRPQGGFARLMYGATTQASRRMIQLAFNRPHGHPRVLVAQSLVGREGLNLHGACRIVVLLHPEWNPAVVEQQIGRVDRVGSHWARQVAAAGDMPADALPRIEVRPVIFRGTYGEHNWNVLRSRWDDLRAQLHGIVIPPRFAEGSQTPEIAALLAEVMAMAPNFSPTIGGHGAT